MITKSMQEIESELSRYSELKCSLVWRSVGSNIFLEFGPLGAKQVSPKTRPPFTVWRADVAIGIHADDWRLLLNDTPILQSDTVDDEALSYVADKFLLGVFMPKFTRSRDSALLLTFNSLITLTIKSKFPLHDHANDYDEVSIKLHDVNFGYNFANGFYLASDS